MSKLGTEIAHVFTSVQRYISIPTKFGIISFVNHHFHTTNPKLAQHINEDLTPDTMLGITAVKQVPANQVATAQDVKDENVKAFLDAQAAQNLAPTAYTPQTQVNASSTADLKGTATLGAQQFSAAEILKARLSAARHANTVVTDPLKVEQTPAEQTTMLNPSSTTAAQPDAVTGYTDPVVGQQPDETAKASDTTTKS